VNAAARASSRMTVRERMGAPPSLERQSVTGAVRSAPGQFARFTPTRNTARLRRRCPDRTASTRLCGSHSGRPWCDEAGHTTGRAERDVADQSGHRRQSRRRNAVRSAARQRSHVVTAARYAEGRRRWCAQQPGSTPRGWPGPARLVVVGDLSAQDRKLISQHEDLGVLGRRPPGQQREPL
jgi:hypothetical protein